MILEAFWLLILWNLLNSWFFGIIKIILEVIASIVFSLYISILQCLRSLHFKTSMSFVFHFSRLQCLQSLHFKTSMSLVFTFQDFNFFSLYISRLQCLLSLHFKDFNVFCLYISKTSIYFVFISQDFNVSYFCYARLQRPLLNTFDTSISMSVCSFTGFISLAFASCRSDGMIARMKLVSLSLLTFSFSIKDK